MNWRQEVNVVSVMKTGIGKGVNNKAWQGKIANTWILKQVEQPKYVKQPTIITNQIGSYDKDEHV